VFVAVLMSAVSGLAALAGGDVVFMLALVLPTLVYLRGTCSGYLALEERDEAPVP
jgi:hypothetical protein